jgi:hypothetical protein
VSRSILSVLTRASALSLTLAGCATTARPTRVESRSYIAQALVVASIDHDGVGARQIGLRPGRKARKHDAARGEDNSFVGVDGADHEIVLVDVDSNGAGEGLKRRVRHATLLV